MAKGKTEDRIQDTGDRRQDNSQSKKVWHITDFELIFKLSDDARKGKKGPLSYTKSFVSLSGSSKPYETRHYERLKYLKAIKDRHLLRSVFEDLKSWSAEKMQDYQGYLVDHAGRPADYEYIAAQLDHIEKNDLKKAMRILAQIGLIEKISQNGQFKHENEDAPDGSGNETVNSGNGADSLQEGKAANAEGDPVDHEEKASNGLSAVEGQDKVIGSAETKANAQRAGQPQVKEPIADKPTESDAGGGDRAKADTRPPPRPVNQPTGQQRAGPLHHAGDYENSDVRYGERIWLALGYNGDIKSEKAVREITSFASKFHECRCRLWGLSPPQIDELGIRGLKQARKIARQKGNRAAKWNDFMTKISKAKSKSG